MASYQDSQLPTMTAAQQTMSSWAKVIESREALPEAYRSSYVMVTGEGLLFPYTVFAPAIAGLRHKATTEKLLCEVSDTIYVWERIGDQVDMAAYPLKTISDLEIGCILLYSWITIGGLTQAGTVSSTTIEYNTATSRHFAPFVNKMRPAPNEMDAREQDVEKAKFGYLAMENFKFANYGLESLVGGEKVILTLWQPKISKPVVKLWGRALYQTTLSLAHLAILTDKEFIVVQDDERSKENRGIRYGGKWRYMALSHISAVSLLEQPGDLLTLTLTLSPGGRRLEFLFAADRKQKAAQLLDELQKVIN
jgi:hypothetical protein